MEDFDQAEGLWRSVFTDRQARLARSGNVGHRRVASAFEETKHPTAISVDRFDEVSSEERSDRGRRSAETRTTGAGRPVVHHGWLVVTVEDAELAGERLVQATPTEDNPYHADIVLLPTRRFTAKDHAVALAAASRWEDASVSS